MIQDIYPHRMHNAFVPGKQANKTDSVFWFDPSGGQLCIRKDPGGFTLPTARDFPGETLWFLFTIDSADYYLLQGDSDGYQPLNQNPKDALAARGFSFASLKSLRGYLSPEDKQTVFAAYTAYQLSEWYRDNRYCGRCKTPTEHTKDERALYCPECSRRIYPRINPAVIVGVTDKDRILMTKYARRGITFYALVAGFTEIGETLEETVAREVMEEVGLKVKNIRYYKSQPWGIADDILAGFFCDVDGDPAVTLDKNELKEATWFSRGDVVGQPDDFSLTNEMMMIFKEGKEPR